MDDHAVLPGGPCLSVINRTEQLHSLERPFLGQELFQCLGDEQMRMCFFPKIRFEPFRYPDQDRCFTGPHRQYRVSSIMPIDKKLGFGDVGDEGSERKGRYRRWILYQDHFRVEW